MAYKDKLRALLAPAERVVLRKLSTPQKIQDFLDAAWRQAQELLEAAQKEAPDLVHSIYVWDASGGLDSDRPGVDLEFTDSPEEIKLVSA